MVIESWGRPSSVPPQGMIPGQRYNGSRGVDYNHTPQLPPKPPGRTLMYVYEQPDGTTTYHTVNHDTPEPPQYAAAGYEVGPPPTPGYSPEQRDTRSASQQGRGYNLLADVGDSIRPSSRAGKLFAKQQERMPRYTSESQAPPVPAQRYSAQPPTPLPRRASTSLDNIARPLPWQQGGKKGGVKWGVPKHLQSQNGYHDDDYKGGALAPLPQPLPEWRAKTEAGYKFGDPPIRPFSTVGYGNTQSGVNGHLGNQWLPGSKIGIPVATVNFDARLYQVAPHRKQVAQDAFTPELFLVRDFNAKPVGWNEQFVDQYFHGRI